MLRDATGRRRYFLKVGRSTVAPAAACALAVLAGAASCAIDIPDVVEGGLDATANEAAPPEAGDEVVPPSCDAGACGAPDGFTPVLFALDQNTPCPQGTTSTDLVADPGATPKNACACDCNVTAQPSCVPYVLAHQLGYFDGGCFTQSSFVATFDGGCNAVSGVSLAPYWRVDSFAPITPGSCTSNATADAGGVTTTASRMCVDPTCGSCTAPPGFQACFMAAGDVACPAGTTHHAAGTAVEVSCATCSSCSVGGTCGGTITFYSDTACATAVGQPVAVDGGCNATGAYNAQPAAMRYDPTVSGVTCKAGTTSVQSTSLASPVTLCCP
jgi:hypothetical protein